MTRFPLMLIVALAAALIAAGCGGDDDEDPTTTTEAATGTTGATGAEGATSEFAQQADEICREGNQELDAAGRERFGDSQQEPSQEEQLSFAEEVVLPNIEQQIDEVTALTPPEGEEETFQEFADQAQSDLEEVQADPSSLLQGAGAEDPFAETNELARQLGLQVCGQN